MDPALTNLLKWGVENSSASTTTTDTTTDPSSARPDRALNPNVLNALFGGPSDADLMRLSMAAILSPDTEVPLPDKLVAFDNFEQLIENLDNANNLAPLGLWTPLLSCLAHASPDIRTMAAWCIGTAVQNNEKSQERLLAMNGVPALARLAVKGDEEETVRRKAAYALSSACRNYQPAMDVLTGELEKLGRSTGTVDAGDMDACDVLIASLKTDAKDA
jgi:hsp70-interacting protein